MVKDEKERLTPETLLIQEAIRLLVDEFGTLDVSYAVSGLGVWVWYEHQITMTAVRLGHDRNFKHAVSIHCLQDIKGRIDALLSNLSLEYDILAKHEETSIERILAISENVFEIPLFDVEWATKHINFLTETMREQAQANNQFNSLLDELIKIVALLRSDMDLLLGRTGKSSSV